MRLEDPDPCLGTTLTQAISVSQLFIHQVYGGHPFLHPLNVLHHDPNTCV